MAKALIQLACRQIINATCESIFEKSVWSASYNEFLLKSQAYNQEGKFTTFAQLKANDGRANSLHYKSGFAVVGFVSTLNQQIPNLATTLGKSILFETHEFEVIDTDITNKQMHQVAIIYTSKPLVLHEIIGEYILVSYNNTTDEQKAATTFMVKMQAQLSVSSYQLL